MTLSADGQAIRDRSMAVMIWQYIRGVLTLLTFEAHLLIHEEIISNEASFARNRLGVAKIHQLNTASTAKSLSIQDFFPKTDWHGCSYTKSISVFLR